LPKIVLQMLRPYSGQLSVGAKHLQDKLSVIAKNSPPNASPVQLLVVTGKLLLLLLPITCSLFLR
jgi:ATP-dependent DNA helicase RecQ